MVVCIMEFALPETKILEDGGGVKERGEGGVFQGGKGRSRIRREERLAVQVADVRWVFDGT